MRKLTCAATTCIRRSTCSRPHLAHFGVFVFKSCQDNPNNQSLLLAAFPGDVQPQQLHMVQAVVLQGARTRYVLNIAALVLSDAEGSTNLVDGARLLLLVHSGQLIHVSDCSATLSVGDEEGIKYDKSKSTALNHVLHIFWTELRRKPGISILPMTACWRSSAQFGGLLPQ